MIPQPEPGPPTEVRVIACFYGCCAGCQDCYGMSIGCHQDPCRCDLPCTCRWKDEDTDAGWRRGCERHDSTNDLRAQRVEPDEDDYPPDDELHYLTPCPECGSIGACAYDDEGRPLVHPVTEEDE